MQTISGSAFINISLVCLLPCGLFPKTHTCSLWLPSIWRTMQHKVIITSRAIISVRVFIHVGVSWLFQCGLYLETHTCWLRANHFERQCYIKLTLQQCRWYYIDKYRCHLIIPLRVIPCHAYLLNVNPTNLTDNATRNRHYIKSNQMW